MKHKPLPPLEELKEYLDYNPDRGSFTWKKKRKYSNIKIGQKAGGLNNEGYHRIDWLKSSYLGHRLAYYMYHGIDPLEKQVDHINGNTLDNRIKNLRLATHKQNRKNSKVCKNNNSGVTGVFWHKAGRKWVSCINVDCKPIYLGSFKKKEDAIQARIEAEKKYFSEFRRNPQIDCDFPK